MLVATSWGSTRRILQLKRREEIEERKQNRANVPAKFGYKGEGGEGGLVTTLESHLQNKQNTASALSHCGFRPRFLLCHVDAYRMQRTVVIDGICSRSIQASQGITAGSGFATDELCCLLLDVMDEIKQKVPEISSALYVDDVTLEAEGQRWQVAQ